MRLQMVPSVTLGYLDANGSLGVVEGKKIEALLSSKRSLENSIKHPRKQHRAELPWLRAEFHFA